MVKPLCFVLMPFGRRSNERGGLVDFDAVYERLLKPSVMDAGLDPLRADEEVLGGFIHKSMFERLIVCEYAVADLTMANPNVLYELGIRHAFRPRSTLIVFARGFELPFDVEPLRGVLYTTTNDGMPTNLQSVHDTIVDRLKASREPQDDSPIYQLLDGLPRNEVDHSKTDTFRDRVEYSRHYRSKLTVARQQGARAVRDIENEFSNLADVDIAIVVDLFLSYRAVKAYSDMIRLFERMSPILRRTVLVREQYAFALNRNGQGEQAEVLLKEIIDKRGPSSETNGLLGRVYKDRWENERDKGNHVKALGLLRQAIETYLLGFEADWRDPYPGVNAVTLMEILDSPDPRQVDILPVVSYAAKQRARRPAADYWDYAALLETAILMHNDVSARLALEQVLCKTREIWDLETTARNLRLIREARASRGEGTTFIEEVEQELLRAAKR